MWPERPGGNRVPALSEIVEGLSSAHRAGVGALLERWLDALDATGRWALLKLVTSGLRVGVSARLAKTALAELGNVEIDRVEEIWHGLAPPYAELFAWLEGRGAQPEIGGRPSFHPMMLANAVEEGARPTLDAADYRAEWKWDGIRIQLVAKGGERRIYSRPGDDFGRPLPGLLQGLRRRVLPRRQLR